MRVSCVCGLVRLSGDDGLEYVAHMDDLCDINQPLASRDASTGSGTEYFDARSARGEVRSTVTSSLGSLLQEGVVAFSSIPGDRPSHQETASVEQSSCKQLFQGEVAVSIHMILGGSLTSFFGGALYTLSPVASVSDLSTLTSNLWLTYVMIIGQFVTNAMFAGGAPSNWRALRARASPTFVALLLLPSAMDVFITGAATVALSLVPAALVGILKTAIQLLSIAVISRLILSKTQAVAAWLALAAVVVGVIIVVAVDLVWRGGGQTPTAGLSQQVVGLALVMAAGWFGAWRNIIEAAILQDDDLPSAALLLAESCLSAVVLSPMAVVLVATGNSTSNLSDTMLAPGGIPFLVLFVLTAYAKDAGKFWLLKCNQNPTQTLTCQGSQFRSRDRFPTVTARVFF